MEVPTWQVLNWPFTFKPNQAILHTGFIRRVFKLISLSAYGSGGGVLRKGHVTTGRSYLGSSQLLLALQSKIVGDYETLRMRLPSSSSSALLPTSIYSELTSGVASPEASSSSSFDTLEIGLSSILSFRQQPLREQVIREIQPSSSP